jgi:beta-glucanase (GH16 family)
MRHGTPWPDCGEIDTFESVSGKDMAYGTLHCKNSCNEPMGRQYKLDFKRGEDIVWAHVVSPDSIEWFKNGQSYHIVKKSDLSPEDWAAVGTKAFYITLNVATGGGWPGPVNDQTIGGKDAALKVKWVAVYKSA